MDVDLRVGRTHLAAAGDSLNSPEEQSMNLRKMELSIHEMTEAFNLEPRESGKNLLLKEWRTSLAKEPHLLEPFQIDQIMREIRKRITPVHHVSNTNSVPEFVP